VPADQKLYTWWSYRSPNWLLADKGRRLDHVWMSESVAPDLGDVHILKEARGWTRPSDHVPVTVSLG
jgi:exodeoxyribonuclease-3